MKTIAPKTSSQWMLIALLLTPQLAAAHSLGSNSFAADLTHIISPEHLGVFFALALLLGLGAYRSLKQKPSRRKA